MTKQRPPVFEREFARLPTGNGTRRTQPVTAVEYANRLDGDQTGGPMVVLLAIGMLGSKRSHKRFVRDLVGRATDKGRDVRVLTYEEPRRHNGYKPEQMMRHLGSALVAASVMYGDKAKLHVVGHSAAASTAAHAAAVLHEDLPGLSSFTSYTPTGDRARARRRDIVDFWGVAIEETSEIRHAFGGGWRGVLGGLAVSGHLLTEAALRASLGPRTFLRAVARSFYHDPLMTANIGTLNEAGVVTNAVMAQYDGTNLYGNNFRELDENGYRNLYVLPDSSHLGALTKAGNGGELFDILQASEGVQYIQAPRGNLALAV